jgi:hypothetical protein
MSMDDNEEFEELVGTDVPKVVFVLFRASREQVIFMKKSGLPDDAIWIKIRPDGTEEWWSPAYKDWADKTVAACSIQP